jgi:hypothetical protein
LHKAYKHLPKASFSSALHCIPASRLLDLHLHLFLHETLRFLHI